MEMFDTFIELLKSRSEKPSVLDIGCGEGLDLRELEMQGVDTLGIDFSRKMADLSKKTSPESEIICDDFLTHDFENKTFQGVIAKDVLHLFPQKNLPKVLKKIAAVLDTKGIAYFSKRVVREEEFLQSLEQCGFIFLVKLFGEKKYLGKKELIVLCEKC